MLELRVVIPCADAATGRTNRKVQKSMSANVCVNFFSVCACENSIGLWVYQIWRMLKAHPMTHWTDSQTD